MALRRFFPGEVSLAPVSRILFWHQDLAGGSLFALRKEDGLINGFFWEIVTMNYWGGTHKSNWRVVLLSNSTLVSYIYISKYSCINVTTTHYINTLLLDWFLHRRYQSTISCNAYVPMTCHASHLPWHGTSEARGGERPWGGMKCWKWV